MSGVLLGVLEKQRIAGVRKKEQVQEQAVDEADPEADMGPKQVKKKPNRKYLVPNWTVA